MFNQHMLSLKRATRVTNLTRVLHQGYDKPQDEFPHRKPDDVPSVSLAIIHPTVTHACSPPGAVELGTPSRSPPSAP